MTEENKVVDAIVKPSKEELHKQCKDLLVMTGDIQYRIEVLKGQLYQANQKLLEVNQAAAKIDEEEAKISAATATAFKAS